MEFMIKFVQLSNNKLNYDTVINVLSVKLLNEPEAKIVLMVKENPFDREIIILKLNENSIIPRSSNIPRLDVFLDIRSILHVAGRLKNPLLICNLKYPILFPRRHEVIDMIVN